MKDQTSKTENLLIKNQGGQEQMKASCNLFETRLYQISPTGIGTPYMESVTSYIKRLAEVHSVSPGMLLSKEILPSTNYFSTIYNPASSLANELTSTLVEKTGLVDIKKLFMGSWNHFFSTKHLFRKSLAWCPICFEESRTNKTDIYEQMLWCFSDVNSCSRHGVKLVEQCPYCLQSITFSRNSRVGFCNRCSSWLGLGYQMNPHLHYVDDDWNTWVNRSIGRLIVANTISSTSFERELVKIFSSDKIMPYRKYYSIFCKKNTKFHSYPLIERINFGLLYPDATKNSGCDRGISG